MRDKKKNKLLQKINDELDNFARTVSHDLRSQLENVNGLTTALEACIDSNHLEEAVQLLPMLNEQTFKKDRHITGKWHIGSLTGRALRDQTPVC
ncbi:light-regulated signal transduction histidine kinase (bacteriophytochrome) [Pontibacter aydingkolensis]|uniref:Signal transduction histidine kinase dimerisation/phosphoacceptor domain-containing protein n=1 Tax=Pontibacter aydingkolensis TaxID=1911536 RepID=A0ABS7CVQ1_9BACT|nr:hypothetical protein [Pontibacter aydingkolensis]MBW7467577.1 hypothetical protein [Pontibacter aydingkolensis]